MLLTLLFPKENRNFRHIPMGMHEKTCANPLKEQRFFPSRQHCLAEVFRYLLTYLTYWSAGRANWPMRCSPKVICVHMFAPERRPCALTDANRAFCVHMFAHLSFRRALTDALGAPPQSRSARQPPVSGSTTNAPAGGAVAKRLGRFTRDTLYRVTKRVFQIISGQSTAYVMRW